MNSLVKKALHYALVHLFGTERGAKVYDILLQSGMVDRIIAWAEEGKL